MSQDNGVIRVGRKGLKKFAFGDGPVFEVDVVEAFQEWIGIDDEFRPTDIDEDRSVPVARMPEYHAAAVAFAKRLSGNTSVRGAPEDITVAEALDFIARLREQYDELADFFRPKSREKRESQDSSVGMRFSTEET
jgi:hypothetical protein